jgi:multimeric flavodoxin WrbA
MQTIVRDRGDGLPLVLACSPRKGGNSDLGAQIIAQTLQSAGAQARLVHLRDQPVLPCRGCQGCGPKSGFACPLMGRDQAEELFGLILAAPVLFFAAPIYFYHVPALFKALIDRAQRYYEAKNAGDPVLTAMPRRNAHVFLVGGRSRGERLFEGTLLSMRYFLWPFGAVLAGDLCLHGIDAPGDLAADEAAKERVAAFALEAWEGRGS